MPVWFFPCATAFAAAFAAGAVNAVAGGGTWIAFPTLLVLGLPAVVANATTTVGLLSASLAGLYGWRREIVKVDRSYFLLALPAMVGGSLGAFLLLHTPGKFFQPLVPFLLLFATVLLILQPYLHRWMGLPAVPVIPKRWVFLALLLQFLAAVYGGYFGAGVSLMMLSIVSLLGLRDILQMNAMANLLAFCINGVAGILFIFAGIVYWPAVGAMAVGGALGAFCATLFAYKIGREWIRKAVIALGFIISAITLARLFFSAT